MMADTNLKEVTNLSILPEEIGSPMNLLTDAEIKIAVEKGYFFRGNDDYDDDQVRQASYELTLGTARTLDNNQIDHVENSKNSCDINELPAYLSQLNDQSWLFLNPLQSCMLFTREQVFLPNNVVGRVNARGQIFSSGIVLESTYIDPGFSGQIHLVAFNSTNKVIRLPVKMAIARLEFMKLTRSVHDPHGGRKSISPPETVREPPPWPIKKSERLAEISEAKRLRQGGNRFLAIDRVIMGLESTASDLKSLEDQTDLNRIVIFGLMLLLGYMYLKYENFDVPLLQGIIENYPVVGDFMHDPFMAIVILFLPAIFKAAFNAEFRTTLVRLVHRGDNENPKS